MCRAFEEVWQEGFREGEQKFLTECALAMLADDVPYETVAKYTKFSLEEIKALDAKKPA